AQGLLMLSNLSALGDKVTYVATKPIAAVDNARAAWSAYRDAQAYLAGFLEMTRPQESRSALAAFETRLKILNDHLDLLSGSIASAAAVDKLKAAQADVAQWAGKARVLLGAAPAVSIPAPHALAQIEVRIRKNLDEMVSLALADAGATRAEVEASI